MDLLDREALTPDTTCNRLAKRICVNDYPHDSVFVDEWYIPMWRVASNHLYVGVGAPHQTCFTKAQLMKLHKQFFHPSSQKLFNLIKRARPEMATPEILQTIMELSRRCDPCQRIQLAPYRFRVSFGTENIRFNERVLMDVLFLNSKPVLHIVDEGTRFSAARLLPDYSTNTIWKTILECWAAVYTRLPNRMLVDQARCFGDSFIHLAAIANMAVERIGVEAHSSLGLGERYHQPLRTTYRKIICAHPKTEPQLSIALAVKSMNDSLGPEGLVPSLLVFGEYPKVATRSEIPTTKLTLGERSKVAVIARKEMERIMAQMRVSRALKHAVPPATLEDFKAGQNVLVWREKLIANRIGE